MLLIQPFFLLQPFFFLFCSPPFFFLILFLSLLEMHRKIDACLRPLADGCPPVAVQAGSASCLRAHAMPPQRFLAIVTEETGSITPLGCSLMSWNSKSPSCRWAFPHDVSLPPFSEGSDSQHLLTSAAVIKWGKKMISEACFLLPKQYPKSPETGMLCTIWIKTPAVINVPLDPKKCPLCGVLPEF